MTKFPSITVDDLEVALPFKFVICSTCRGHGKSSAYLGAFTGDQMREDPDFARDYMAGEYDRTCEKCEGSGKVAIPHKARMTTDQKLAWREQQELEREMRAEERSEYRMSPEYLMEIRGGY